MTSSVYTNTFKRRASLLQDIKVTFNKDFMRSINLGEKCLKRAYDRIGSDIHKLESEASFRGYLLENFGYNNYSFFISLDGHVKLDLEHMILLYHKLRNENSPLVNPMLGIMAYVAGKQISREMDELSKTSVKGIITPVYDLSVNTFRWKRCNHILRKYAMYLTVPEGYKAYYYEKPYLAQIAYLCSLGKSLTQAEDAMFDHPEDSGLFYSYLPKRVENILASGILDNQFSNMNGYYASQYETDNVMMANNPMKYTVFTGKVKPIMIELVGAVMYGFLEELKQHQALLAPTDVYVYHVSPYRFGILVKDDFKIEELLPEFSKNVEPVNPMRLMDISSIIEGYYL